MSTASKVTLGLTSAATLAIIYSVHYSQVQDRQKLHEGVVRYTTHRQCCGSESGSVGSICFWASWIRIRIH
jgi:hypothetical protein